MSEDQCIDEPIEDDESWEDEYEMYLSEQIANMGTKWDF